MNNAHATFAKTFDSFACFGDTIETEGNGFRFVATINPDDYSRPDDYECYDDEQMRGWNNDEWSLCGIVISVFRGDVKVLEHAASLWGIELNLTCDSNDYLTEVANELLRSLRR